jgi:hypothetical protein
LAEQGRAAELAALLATGTVNVNRKNWMNWYVKWQEFNLAK